MRIALYSLAVFFVWLSCAGAQTPSSEGVAPEWEVRKNLNTLADHVKRWKPVLDQIKPEKWVKNGAPAAYVEQGERIGAEADYLLGTAQALARQPDRLTTALETLFRMQALDALLRSYAAGVRKYQNSAIADLLQSMVADTAADRDKLREYVTELAADKEQQLRIMDEEAQRCRAMTLAPPRNGHRPDGRKEERK